MKNKHALIISSIIMIVVIVVTVIGASAAWFGDIKRATTGSDPLSISSDHPSGTATFDADSAATLNGNLSKLVPAVASTGWLLSEPHYDAQENIINMPHGKALRTATASVGVASVANVVTIYIPFVYRGSADPNVTDGKKAIRIKIDSAHIKINGVADTSVNYINDFFIDYGVVFYDKEEGTVSEEDITLVDDISDLNSGSEAIFYGNDEDNRAIYMLIEPYFHNYAIKVQVSYNFVDEELNPATIYKTIMFSVDIEQIERSVLVNKIPDLVIPEVE